MAHTIVEDSLEYAIGTNNAAVMLTLAKTVAMLNNNEAIVRRARGTIDTIPGAPKSPRLLRQETIDLVNERVSAQNLETVRHTRSHRLRVSLRPWKGGPFVSARECLGLMIVCLNASRLPPYNR